MTTVVEKTIGTGGDYTTLQSWEDDCPSSLTTDDKIWKGLVLNQEITGTGPLLTVSGSTTDAARYIELTTEAGASFVDNANVQTNTLRYNASNGAAITSGTAYQKTIYVGVAYTRVSRLQVSQTATGASSRAAVWTAYNVAGISFDQCIFESASTTTSAEPGSLCLQGHSTQYVSNSLIVNVNTGSTGVILGLGNSAKAYNCTCVSVGSSAAYGVWGNYGATALKNVYVGGATTLTAGSSTVSATTCVTDLSSPPAGWTGSVALSTTNFVNVTAGTHDLRTVSGAGLIDVGTTDTTYAATDIAGTARPSGSAYDAGAWEYVQAGGVTLVIANATHGHSADGLGLTTQSLLAINEATHAHSADNLGLSVDAFLAVQEATHGHTADNLGLSVDAFLAVQEATHGHTADNLTLDTSSAVALTIQGAVHAHSADGVTLSLDSWLSIADSLHLHTTDGVALSCEETLVIAEALHAHSAENLTLSFSSFSAEQLAEILAHIQENLVVPTAEQIAAAVRSELATELTRLSKLAALSAIDATLVVTPTSRTAGDVTQTIATVGDTTTVESGAP